MLPGHPALVARGRVGDAAVPFAPGVEPALAHEYRRAVSVIHERAVVARIVTGGLRHLVR